MIYFIQATDGGPVKIGHSVDVPRRVSQLQSHYGRRFVILATMRGGKAREGQIHQRFAHLRFGRLRTRGVQPEQFRPAPDLMAFIGQAPIGPAALESTEAMDPGVRVGIDRSVFDMASLIAKRRGVNLTHYLNEILGPLVGEDVAHLTD